MPAEPDVSDPNTRTLWVHDRSRHAQSGFPNNSVRTAKYTAVSFIPLNLYAQFRRFANVFYLIVSILSFFRVLWPSWYGNVVPLIMVLTVSAIKEAVEDWNRHKEDKAQNESEASLLSDGKWDPCQWQKLEVGDIITITKNKPIPADVIVVASSDPTQRCYIETASLDGETNSKLREAVPHTAQMQSPADLSTLRGSYFQCNQPIIRDARGILVPQIELYKFDGTWTIGDRKIPVGVPNVLLRGSILVNTEWVIAFVVYSGKDTKLMLNSSRPPIKMSNVERLMNHQLYVIFGFLLFMCVVSAIGASVWGNNAKDGAWYLGDILDDVSLASFLTFLTSIIAFSFIIPISLYVSMEIVKMLQIYFMRQDVRMYHEETDQPAQTRTSNLNEELGQIKYVFSDKTGTLTCNRMDFIRCSINSQVYGASMKEREEMQRRQQQTQPLNLGAQSDPKSPIQTGTGFSDERLVAACHQGDAVCVEFLRMLSLCHTVIPEVDGGNIHYGASSPDEKALVEAARDLGFTFLEKTPTTMTIDAMGTKETYTVLNVLEFNSNRKRMSVILRSEQNRYLLYCKGADSMILERLSPLDRSREPTMKHLDEFAVEGLRTLCLAARELSEMEWAEWNSHYVEAATAVKDREQKLEDVAELIEKDLTLLGATAIEDKLQDGVPECIKQLYRASIKVWMLTGDKQETAINIGHSCGLLTASMHVFVLNESTEQGCLSTIQAGIEKMNADSSIKENAAVVIDGSSLTLALLTPEVARQFLDLADRCKGVICCRVSPKQKAQVVKLVKDNVADILTLSIGDGANDVAMIQEAHVGVGISGLEGNQAVLASDYALAQFRFLEPLLLIHGRWCYKRIARMILYFFHKNLLFTLPQFFFIFFQGFSGMPLYEVTSGSLYNVVFSSLPVIVLALFDQDVKAEDSLAYPELYLAGQKKQTFNLRRHVAWSISAIIQGILIFFPVVIGFMGDVVDPDGGMDGVFVMGASVYCIVVFVVNLKIAQITSSWNLPLFVVVVLSMFIWFPFMAIAPFMTSVFPNLWGVLDELAATPVFPLAIVWTVVVCLMWDHAFKYAKRMYDPEPFHIVQELSKGGSRRGSQPEGEEMQSMPMGSAP